MVPELCPAITVMVRHSLEEGIFPSNLGKALVKPIKKAANLSNESLSSFRPVSLLPFVSKVIEKSVQCQLVEYLEEHRLYPSEQSGYRKFHSCETLNLKLNEDMLIALDGNKVIALVMLDMSAAFDTVDHTQLLGTLYHVYGITSTPLKWFQSYLECRRFSVNISGSHSTEHLQENGVPQGSILGPILFILYAKHIQHIAGKTKQNETKQNTFIDKPHH